MAKQHAPGFLKIVTDAKTRVKECTVADVQAKRARGEPFVLVDVREDSEFAAGHVPGAVHIGGRYVLSFDAHELRATAEEIPISDEHLRSVWGERVERLVLTTQGTALRGGYRVVLREAK